MGLPSISRTSFLREFGAALQAGRGALFVGAGASMPSGYASWASLLAPLAQELRLDIKRESDLIALAQYVANQRGGRGYINQHLVNEFARSAKPSQTHELLAKLPVRAIWTTNYDHLLEDALRAIGKRVDVKQSEHNLAVTVPQSDVSLYKMHGDVQHPDRAILLKEDYEDYAQKHPGFSAQLSSALTSHVFLFIGFSFTDPNIDYFLAQLRTAMGSHRSEHYWVTASPQEPGASATTEERDAYEYAINKLTARIIDLKRYGIQTVLIRDYKIDLPQLLKTLDWKSRSNNVFVSGSAALFDPLGATNLEALCASVGRGISERSQHLLSAIGANIGRWVAMNALEACVARNDTDFSKHLTLRQFSGFSPSKLAKEDFEKKVRLELLSRSGFAIFISGNKSPPTGATIDISDGVMEEFKLATKLSVYPIPIGSSGYAAKEIWARVDKDFATYFPGLDHDALRKPFEELNHSHDIKVLEKAVFGLMDLVRKKVLDLE
ncbi:MAG TPA: SIR2 family protein [Pseudomonadota bacterium]|nr:SIR2 family protein [Pseudomonadota bacterium]